MTRILKSLLLTALLLLPCAGMAHEISTTTVRLTLHGSHTWTAFIVTAPQTLANKLELEAGRPRSSGLTEAALRAELDGFLAALARHIDVRFDGVKSPAAVSISDIQVVLDAVRPDFIELKATGSIPPGARTVSWQYGLVYSTYALHLAVGDDAEPQTHWLQGDIASRPFPIAVTVKPR